MALSKNLFETNSLHVAKRDCQKRTVRGCYFGSYSKIFSFNDLSERFTSMWQTSCNMKWAPPLLNDSISI